MHGHNYENEGVTYRLNDGQNYENSGRRGISKLLAAGMNESIVSVLLVR
jgi:hypothetical protein